MVIRCATKKDFEDLRNFYDYMCHVLGEKDFLPEGNKGGFPSDHMIMEAIEKGEQFLGIEDEHIAAAYIMNHDCDNAYRTVQWHVNASDDEMVVLHALRVLPQYGGRGYSKQLVRHAIDTATQCGIKCIRLDCIEGNDVPQKMYCSFGFQLIETVEITYADIGVPRLFHLYELALS